MKWQNVSVPRSGTPNCEGSRTRDRLTASESSLPLNQCVNEPVSAYNKSERHYRECEVFAQNLIRAREVLGMNQRQLQLVTGITQSHVSAIERCLANPSLRTMTRLARAVGVPLHVLLRPKRGKAPTRSPARVRRHSPTHHGHTSRAGA